MRGIDNSIPKLRSAKWPSKGKIIIKHVTCRSKSSLAPTWKSCILYTNDSKLEPIHRLIITLLDYEKNDCHIEGAANTSCFIFIATVIVHFHNSFMMYWYLSSY